VLIVTELDRPKRGVVVVPVTGANDKTHWVAVCAEHGPACKRQVVRAAAEEQARWHRWNQHAKGVPK